MNTATMRFGSEQTYTVEEMLTDLTDGVFAEIKTKQAVDGNKRYLQKLLANYLIKNLAEAEVIPDPSKENLLVGTDVPVVLRAHLTGLGNQCKEAAKSYSDPLMAAHLKYISDKIDYALNPKN
jgi:hypothetical protein